MSVLRTPFVDQIRGIALLGIALVNAPFLAISLNGERGSAEQSALDTVAAFLIQAFAQGKFYLLFSFLFGYSVSRFMRPETDEGDRRFRRRLVALGVLGILHAFLFFIGDILFSYAVLGCALLPVLRRPDTIAVKWAKISASVAGSILLCLTILGTLILETDSVNR